MRKSFPPWFDRACGAIAFFVPFVVSLVCVASFPVWRADLPLVRGLGWVGAGRTGAVSAILVGASFFLPLGSIEYRAGLASALLLAASGLAIFRLTFRILERGTDSPRLSAALATIAALTATLGSTGQREGAVAGGGCAALLLAVSILAIEPVQAFGHPRGAVSLGLLFGALVGESGVVALALALGVALAFLGARSRPRRAEVAWALGGAVASLAFVCAPIYIRPFARATFLDVGGSIARLGRAGFETSPRALGAIGVFRDEVGYIALGFALAGGVVALACGRLRASLLPLVVVVLLDLAAASQQDALVSSEGLAPLHLVAFACLSVGVAVAVHAIALTLLDMRLAMARETTLFLVMGDLALAAANAEEAWFSADRSISHGAEAFTDEAVERLPPGAVVLVRSSFATHRLFAARLVHGTRPDVLVVPTPLLGNTDVALGLLRAEPALRQSLRDASLEGRPGEEALTILADARPVMVELDPGWDRRVVSHLVADHFWLRFAPEPLGPSDRKAAFGNLRAAFARVLAESTVDDHVDPATAAALRARLVDAAAEAAMLGERDEAISLAAPIDRLSSGDRFVAELTQRLARSKSGPVDVRGLVR